jgi:hypothetical protein
MHIYISHHYYHYFVSCFNVTICEETNSQSKDPGALGLTSIKELYRIVAYAQQICYPKRTHFPCNNRAVEGVQNAR